MLSDHTELKSEGDTTVMDVNNYNLETRLSTCEKTFNQNSVDSRTNDVKLEAGSFECDETGERRDRHSDISDAKPVTGIYECDESPSQTNTQFNRSDFKSEDGLSVCGKTINQNVEQSDISVSEVLSTDRKHHVIKDDREVANSSETMLHNDNDLSYKHNGLNMSENDTAQSNGEVTSSKSRNEKTTLEDTAKQGQQRRERKGVRRKRKASNEVWQDEYIVTKYANDFTPNEDGIPVRYKCRHCSKTFDVHYTAFRHFVTHTDRPKAECEVCGRVLSCVVSLFRHMKLIHVGMKPFQCPHCESTFKLNMHLLAHLRTHKGEGPYKCHLCDKRFMAKSNLTEHLRNHSTFICDHCGQSYESKVKLQKHMRIHMEKKFQCDFCDAAFVRKDHFQKHIGTHSDIKQWECEICHKSFRLETYLWRHKHKTHEPKHKVPTHSVDTSLMCTFGCRKIFDTAKKLQFHVENRPYTCEVCDEAFCYLRMLIDHRSKMKHFSSKLNDEPLEQDLETLACDFCDYVAPRMSNLKRHLLSHFDQRNVTCNICHEAFRYKYSLVRHMECHTKLLAKSPSKYLASSNSLKKSKHKYVTETNTNAASTTNSKRKKSVTKVSNSSTSLKKRKGKCKNVAETSTNAAIAADSKRRKKGDAKAEPSATKKTFIENSDSKPVQRSRIDKSTKCAVVKFI